MLHVACQQALYVLLLYTIPPHPCGNSTWGSPKGNGDRPVSLQGKGVEFLGNQCIKTGADRQGDKLKNMKVNGHVLCQVDLLTMSLGALSIGICK